MLIRRASIADLEAVTAIYRHYVLNGASTFEIEPPDLTEMRHRFDSISSTGLPYLVAESDGLIAGYAYAAPYRVRPAYRFTVEDSIYVAAGFERCGIGGALLGELIARCEARGCRQMIAVIGDSANAGSVKLHSRFGFRTVGVFESVGFKFGRWIDTVLMQRSLGHGAKSLP